jgi:hypothetical protein
MVGQLNHEQGELPDAADGMGQDVGREVRLHPFPVLSRPSELLPFSFPNRANLSWLSK